MTDDAAALVGEHTAQRPLWICRADRHPWPCAEARRAMTEQARQDRVALCVFLAGALHEMIADTYRLNPDSAPDPRVLARRVFGWLPARRPPV